MNKPSDLNPLFSDEDATPEEIARARRIVAYQELKEAAQSYFALADEIGHTEYVPLAMCTELVAWERRIFNLALKLVAE